MRHDLQGGRERVRMSAKAVIVRDGALCVISKRDADGPWYVLPGGGQQPGESLTHALVRECREEIGVTVVPGRIVWCRDYIDDHHPEFPHARPGFHQAEVMFEATLAPGAKPDVGHEPDGDQHGVAWLPLAELSEHRLFPVPLRELLQRGLPEGLAGYLGDVY